MALPAERKIDGKQFVIYDAFETKRQAEQYAADIRKQGIYPAPLRTLARVYDGGKYAGRLRYGVYVRPR